jgi:hypothetical protein
MLNEQDGDGLQNSTSLYRHSPDKRVLPFSVIHKPVAPASTTTVQPLDCAQLSLQENVSNEQAFMFFNGVNHFND